MTKYTKAGLVTDDPVIAAMFIGKEISKETWLCAISTDVNTGDNKFVLIDCVEHVDECKEITIPRPVVKAILHPLPAGAVFITHKAYEPTSYPAYGRKNVDYSQTGHIMVKACPLTIGRTVGELCELLKWCEGDQNEM